MVECTFIEILIVWLLFKNRHTIALGKNVWTFGNDDSQSVIIDSKEGGIDAFSNGLNYNIIAPRCHRVVYVRVEVDNPVSIPDVNLNFENVIIKYVQDQMSESTYKILVKGIETCNTLRIGKCNGVGNICGYYDGSKNTWSFKESTKRPKNNSSDSFDSFDRSDDRSDFPKIFELSQRPGKHVWRFGKNHPKSILLVQDIGFIQDNIYNMTFQIKQSKPCVKIVYVKVVVLNEESKPKVSSDFKTVKIKYKRGQQTASQYEILAKGITKCKSKFLFV